MADFQHTAIITSTLEVPAIIRPLEDHPSKFKAAWDHKATLVQDIQAVPPAPPTPYEKMAALAERRLGPAPGLEGIAVPSIN